MTQFIWIIAFNCSLWSCFSWQKYNKVTEILVYKERVVICPQILQLNTTSISFLLEAVTAWSVKNWFQRASHSWTTFPWSHWPKTQMQYFSLICFRDPWSGNTSLECYPETTERNTSSTVYAEQIHMLLVTQLLLWTAEEAPGQEACIQVPGLPHLAVIFDSSLHPSGPCFSHL